MDILSRIAGWLGENEATISALVGIMVLAGALFAGVRWLVRKRAEAAPGKAPAAVAEPAPAEDASAPDLDPLTVPGFEGRPAIAVLALDNLSGDPEQEYFADGIAEDLITRLSAWRAFPVIARNSSFVYKGKPVDVKQISRELGVRYVVEGSVRKARDRVRIGAQLIDATSGAHVWAETYDRQLRDIFAVQDEITEAIGGSIYPELLRSEQDRAVRKQSRDLDAWDCFWRASRHGRRYSKDGNAEARALLQRAIELDPNFAWPYAGLAVIHHEDVLNQWTESPSQSVLQAGEAVRKAIELANDDPFVQYAQANVHRLTGQLDRAVDAFRRVVQLDPSYGFAFYQLGLVLACTGEPDRAIDHIETAMRLSPKDPWFNAFFFGMAMAHAAAGRYEEAVRAAQQSIQLNSGFPSVFLTLAASYVGLGRLEEARSTVQDLLRLNPAFSLTGFKAFISGWDPGLAERSIDALRVAGLPE